VGGCETTRVGVLFPGPFVFSRRLLLDLCAEGPAPPTAIVVIGIRNYHPQGYSSPNRDHRDGGQKRCWNSLRRVERNGKDSADATSACSK
jgi:hypothetical protein